LLLSLSSAIENEERKKKTHLRHREHVRDADGVVVDELPEHQAHDLHRHARPA
jgi:hypothetical protein